MKGILYLEELEWTVKFGDKEQFDKEQIGVKEPFLASNCQFKVATSRTKYDKKDCLHSAFGAFENITEDQKAVFEELRMYMIKTKFGPNFFAEGIRMYIDSLYGLHDYMKTKFDLGYTLTSHVENDHHERFIGVIRQFDGKGGNRRPTALQLTYRISR